MKTQTDVLTLEGAIALATKLHAGQVDKSGRPYMGHLERVAEMVRRSGGNWVQEMAAWLHDSLEDTEATEDLLWKMGVPRMVIELVVCMTHDKSVPNEVYWRQIREIGGPATVLVKLCDCYDNLDPSRMCYLPVEAQTRLRRKYANAILALTEE